MIRKDAGGMLFIAALLALLFVIAAFLPRNPITSDAPEEASCRDGGCLELCDADAQCGDDGMVCCPAAWERGVCAYAGECGAIAEHSRYQSVEVYADSMRERPSPVQADWSRFFLPLLLAVAAVMLGVRMWKKG